MPSCPYIPVYSQVVPAMFISKEEEPNNWPQPFVKYALFYFNRASLVALGSDGVAVLHVCIRLSFVM